MNSVVFGQSPKYYLNSAIEAQQIGSARSVNFTSQFQFGLEYKKQLSADLGFGYRWHQNPNKSDFFRLRWFTLSTGIN